MDDRPTLLMLGSGEPMRAALEEALVRYAALPEAADADSPVASVLAAAPDLVVLLGDAARAHATILPKLAANALTASVPVALLSPEGLDVRLSAARFGVVLVPRTASADEMARQMAQLAREMPERPTQSGGAVGEGTLEELLDILRRELQGGILSVSQEGGRAARFVLRPGRNVEVAIRDFVKRIKPLVKESKPLHYELDDPGTGKLAVLDDDSDDGDRAILVGRRILLVEDDAATADALAQELRGQGAIVAVATSQGGGLERARALDPEVVLVDEAALDGEGFAVLRTIRRDLSLRWASILVARLRDLLPAETAPRMDRLAGSLAPLLAPDREIAELAKKNQRFEARMETCGPSRLLRALAASGNTFHVTARHPRVVVELDIAEGLVAGADATPMGDAARRASGTAAVAALLAVGSARVTVEPREAPTSANLLMPVSDVFMAATKESPPIRPSLPPPTSQAPGSSSSLPPPALLGELRRVLDQLREQGLADLTGEHDLAAVEAVVDGMARPGPRRKATLVGMPAPALPDPSAPDRSAAEPSGPPLPPLSDVPTSSISLGTPRMPAPRVPAPVPTPAAVAAKVPRAVPKVAVPRVAVPKVAGAAKAASATKPSVPPPAPAIALAKSAPPPTPAAAKSVPPPTPPSPAVAKSVPPPAPAIARAKSVPPPTPSTPPAAPRSVPPPAPSAADWASAPPPPHVAEPLVAPSVPEPATSNTATESLDAFDIDAAMAEPMASTPLQPTPAPSAFADLDEEPLLAKPNRTWIYVVAGVAVLGLVVVGALVAFGGDDGEASTHASPPAASDTPLTAPSAIPTETTPTEPAEPTQATPTEPTPEPEAEATPTEEPEAEATPTEEPEAETTPTEEPEATPEEPEVAGDEGDEGDGDEDEGEGEGDEDEGDEDTPTGNRDRLRELVSSGNFFRGRAQWDRARRSYEGALRIAPRNGPALAGLAKIALAQRRAPEAVRYARTLVQVNPRTAGNHVLLGDALSASGDRSGARSAWEAALRINPRHRTARARLAR